jgi:hypothetical protein
MPRFRELDKEERTAVARRVRHSIRRDKAAEMPQPFGPDNLFGVFSGGYAKDRGLFGRGRDEKWRPGYNDLHGVDFRDGVRRLQDRFPGEVIEGLDIGYGHGNFGWDLMDELNRGVGPSTSKARTSAAREPAYHAG